MRLTTLVKRELPLKIEEEEVKVGEENADDEDEFVESPEQQAAEQDKQD